MKVYVAILIGATVIQASETTLLRVAAALAALATIVVVLRKFWTNGIKPLDKKADRILAELGTLRAIDEALQNAGLQPGTLIEHYAKADQALETATKVAGEMAEKRQERAEMKEKLADVDGRLESVESTLGDMTGKFDELIGYVRRRDRADGTESPF